jgi:hypothetical protein
MNSTAQKVFIELKTSQNALLGDRIFLDAARGIFDGPLIGL